MAETKKAGRPPVKKPQTNRAPKESNTKQTKSIQRIKIPLDYVIPVKSGVQGGLIYVSRKNGYEIIWDEYGAIEYIQFEELVAMRNSNKRFFVDNWVFFEDADDYTAEEIYRALMVDKYYSNILDIENIDDLLSLQTEQLENRLTNIPNGVKDTIVTRAKQMMIEKDPIMDSVSKREMIEKVFNVELIPRDI